MPTPEEKRYLIEAALCRRFFPHVAEIDAQTDMQHEVKRLSHCLAALALVQHCNVDDETAARAITDGSNDGGIDALYFDRSGKRLVFVQAKYKVKGGAPSQDETLKTITGVREIEARLFHHFNEAIQNLHGDIDEALNTPDIKLCLLFVFLGDAMNLQAANNLDSFCNEYFSLAEWHPIGVDPIFDRLVEDETPKTVDARITLENWAHVTTSPKAVYGQMCARDLAQLVETYGSSLFERNVRHYLRSIGVNSAIEKTVLTRPDRLFYLNNGITAVANSIAHATGSNARRVFGVKGLSIVNGAQTAGAIANAMLSGNISPEAKIMITIVEIGDDNQRLGLEITRARNHQNFVRESDFAGLDPNQERLRRELAVLGITYHYRSSSDARVPRDDAFTLDEAAVALACMKFSVRSTDEMARSPRQVNTVDFIVVAKRSVGRLSDPEDNHYKKLFSIDQSGIHMYRTVQIYRFIDRILAETEHSEAGTERRLFFRHARFFIVAFVALRVSRIVNQARLTFSEEEREALSRQTNQVSEEVYSAMERLQFIKGPWAIFSNLTDSQQLANYVLQRTMHLDAPQATA